MRGTFFVFTSLAVMLSGLILFSAPVSGADKPNWRCQSEYQSYKIELGLSMNGKKKPARINGNTGKKWWACAKKGSKLSVRFYVGKTRDEVKKAQKPVYTVSGLEKKARIDKKFPAMRLCKYKPKYIGYEFHGTGEMARLNSSGRSIKEANCW